MRGHRFTNYFCAVLAVCALVVVPAAAAPGNLVLQVPDWNQPTAYGVAGYPGWCSPTSGANVMGYWEDVMGCTGLTDAVAFPASPAYAATAGTWQQGLWHDGTVEMGWYMDTGGWQSVPRPFPPNVGNTLLANIGPGMQTYASTGWVDGGTGITKTAYANTTVAKDTARNATMWANYKAEIDAGRPTVSSFAHWVGALIGTDTVDGFNQTTIEKYAWNTDTEEHSVTGVGYIDTTPGFQNDGVDEWFVVHDNWGTTGQFVAVPLDTNWLQNDYVTNVPEPITLGLLAVGAMAVVLRRKAA